MPHIPFKEGLPGINGPMDFRPETNRPLNELAEILLRGPSTLLGERELIAAFVSSRNDYLFCQSCQRSCGMAFRPGFTTLVEQVKRDYQSAPVSNKLKALLNIASKVQQGGKNVTADDIAAAREQDATDIEIHDTVLIAAAFCMYNRYVDGLATWAPENPEAYYASGKRLAEQGYM